MLAGSMAHEDNVLAGRLVATSDVTPHCMALIVLSSQSVSQSFSATTRCTGHSQTERLTDVDSTVFRRFQSAVLYSLYWPQYMYVR